MSNRTLIGILAMLLLALGIGVGIFLQRNDFFRPNGDQAHDETAKLIVGKWDNGEGVTEFTADGRYSSPEITTTTSDAVKVTIEKRTTWGTYRFTAPRAIEFVSQVRFVPNPQTYSATVEEITADRLVLKYTGSGEVVTMKRIKD